MDFNFACTACGKCCNSPPMFYLAELMDQADHFVLAMHYEPLGGTDPSKKKDVAAARDAYSRLGKFSQAALITTLRLAQETGKINGWRLPVKIGGIRPYFAPAFTDVSIQDKRCPQLQDDGLCGIHRDRPHICKLVPFGTNRSLKFNAETIPGKIIERVESGDWECDISDQAPTVIRDGKFTEKAFSDAHDLAHHSRASWLGAITANSLAENAFAALTRLSGLDGPELAERIMDAVRNRSSISADLRPVAHGLIMEDPNGIALARELLDRQINAINRRLDSEGASKNPPLAPLTLASNGESRSETYARLRTVYTDTIEMIDESEDG